MTHRLPQFLVSHSANSRLPWDFYLLQYSLLLPPVLSTPHPSPSLQRWQGWWMAPHSVWLLQSKCWQLLVMGVIIWLLIDHYSFPPRFSLKSCMCVPVCMCFPEQVWWSIFWYLGWRLKQAAFWEGLSAMHRGKDMWITICPSKSNHRKDDRKQEFPLFGLNPHLFFLFCMHSTAPPRDLAVLVIKAIPT